MESGIYNGYLQFSQRSLEHKTPTSGVDSDFVSWKWTLAGKFSVMKSYIFFVADDSKYFRSDKLIWKIATSQ